MVELLLEQLAQRRHRVGDPPLGHVEHQRLRPVDGQRHVVGGLVAELGDLTGHSDDAAKHGVLLDDPPVARRAADRRRACLEGDERRRTTHRIEQTRPAQLVGNGDGVDRLALTEERGDRVVDMAVDRLVEVVGGHDLDGRGDGVATQEHRAEQRLLGLDAVRGDPSAVLLPPPHVFDRLNHVGVHPGAPALGIARGTRV